MVPINTIQQQQLQEIMHEETKFALFKLKRKYIESDDKAGKNSGKEQIESKHLISIIYDCNKQLIQEPKQIDNCFKTHYKKLYKSICLPSVEGADKKELEEYIRDAEISV